ncbi:drs2 neo1 protein [Conoideocrella luteorostrata]|uniref:Phospholipid-transporting ATPase n=1 Tax=Conoideocrella luteorostrata TaxID=1105319 RepID=A0AAJ0CHH7_9HYPO|nr:drs2 neo1 protein [Conoideocrella luteorostrata]
MAESDCSTTEKLQTQTVRESPIAAPAIRIPSTQNLQSKIKSVVGNLYQATVVDFVLRRKLLVASKDGRRIPLSINHNEPLIDVRRGHAYISNNVRTSRYTIWDFIPKQLFFQFTRVGNFYFLCVGVPQMIPGLSTTGSYTTILPLLFFILLTIVKEGYDDFRRHRLDKVENANFATVLGREDHYTGKIKPPNLFNRLNPFHVKTTARPRPLPDDEFHGVRWVPTRWSNVKVGDVVRLSRDEPVPADLVLMHSDGENSLAYIDTMALDGETNLKTKQVCHTLESCGTIEGIANCKAEFVVEDPNPELFNFEGRVTVDGKTAPLTLNEVIYRGSVMRNTTAATGLVINTGEDCKVRMNSNRHPRAKKPALEKVVNMVVITLATYVIILSVGVSMGYVKWKDDYEQHAWYLDQATVPFYQIIIAFIIMFNNVVPLALYISLEIVKIGQLLLLNSDIDMYHEESDTPARCNTNTILENLGQVGYIFSDKTGTLTDNIMNFRKLSVAGTVWLHEMDLAESEDTPSPAACPEEASYFTRKPSMHKSEAISPVIHEEGISDIQTPMSPSRLSTGGRRTSSQWRSTGRPDHVQPEVNTTDLVNYLRIRPHSAFSRKAREYLLAVALCHTCLPEIKDGKMDFQASSPDELALVRAAQELGYLVTQRTIKSITLQVPQSSGGVERLTFEILDIIEFSSARKRMSIVVRYPDGRICIICKGADSAVLPRLRLASLAMQKANEVRKSADLEHELYRRSQQHEPRNSFGGRPSLTVRRTPGLSRGRSIDQKRESLARRKSFEVHKLMRVSDDRPRGSSPAPRGVSFDVSRTRGTLLSPSAYHAPLPIPEHLKFLEDTPMYDESEVFTRCFKHLDDFATEGLRTLLYAQKFVPEHEYGSWKKGYDDASTSLVNRQELIEAAGEAIEQSLDLVGATAIEDKLQQGVPETVDRLRRANIKIWMLTGDKRETAINIAHSARICRPGSDLYILDVAKEPLEPQLLALAEELHAGTIHSVVVIDGQTLAAVEKSKTLSKQFFSIMLLVDSVICCRASPAQKALLVRTVRSSLGKFKDNKHHGLTLAIGDGANDLAMIQASHVGIGISGQEGLQAARVADYAIAQFRYLQRLLLVHGRWNYVRTSKFILYTFWKEMFFYLPTAQYQRYNGYTGTSLYQSTSLTVFNTLFTSLCTICLGIWEQDLSAETLLAVPELYVYGQRNMGLNTWKYIRWMLLAAVEGVIAWCGVWAAYGWISPAARDEGLYALGTLVFTVGILWINWKLFVFETHYKSSIVMGSFFLTTWGWFAWLCFLDGVYAPGPEGPYNIRHTFTQQFGRDAVWWATVFIVLALMGAMELLGKTIKRNMLVAGVWHWPPWKMHRLSDNVEEWDLQVWQEMEQDPKVREKLRRLANDEATMEDLEEEDVYNLEARMDR